MVKALDFDSSIPRFESSIPCQFYFLMEIDLVSNRERVIKVVAEQLGLQASEITMEKSFTDLGADSLDVVELVMAFEDEFNIQISDEDAARITNVSLVMDYISEKCPA